MTRGCTPARAFLAWWPLLHYHPCELPQVCMLLFLRKINTKTRVTGRVTDTICQRGVPSLQSPSIFNCPPSPLLPRSYPLQAHHKLLFLFWNRMFSSNCPVDGDSPAASPSQSIHNVWLESRRFEHKGEIGHLTPGAHRPFTLQNVCLAYEMVRVHTLEMFRTIWVPRTSLVFFFNLCRGVFPAFRGFYQALIIDKVRLLITHGCTGPSAHTRYTGSLLHSLLFLHLGTPLAPVGH